LKLCKQITAKLNLPAISLHFEAVHFYDGIVDLCLTAAGQRDPHGRAQHFYNNGEPIDDQQGLQAYVARTDCYRTITDILGQLMAASQSHPQAPSVPKSPGAPPAPDPSMLTPAEAKQYAEQVLQQALSSDDELVHVTLYTWLVDKQMMERLLEVRSPHLEPFLKRASASQPDSLPTLDLLWMYYEKNANYSAAARIQSKLADRHGVSMTLKDRIEYLSRAIVCIQSSTTRPSARNEGEFLHELEEKMEVAQLQLQVLESLQQVTPRSVAVQDAISRLNSDLLDISALYEDYAEPFRLPEVKLAIIHCAGHYDPMLVETLWQEIVQKEIEHHADSPPNTIVVHLSNRIKFLGKLYSSTTKYFPLVFLVKLLEVRSCALNLDNKWVFTTLHSVGVSLAAILDAYDKLYRSRDSCWSNMKRPLHLLTVTSLLIGWFADTPLLVIPQERRHLVTLSLDCVSRYMVDLQALGLTDPTVQALVSRLRGTQAKLDRIL